MAKSFTLRLIEVVAHRWWFLVPIVLVQLIPPYASHGYDLRDLGMVNAHILTHPIKGSFTNLFPIFQITLLILIGVTFYSKRKAARIFSGYVALSYGVMAFLQNISMSDKYGFAVCTGNVLTFLCLAGLWFWDTLQSQTEFVLRKPPAWKYGLIGLALLPLWEPVNPITSLPDFNPVYVFTSGAGLSFCLATPLYLAVLSLYFPQVNQTVFAATGFVGVMMGLGNMVLEFLIYPAYWWIGVLHIPLLVISLYSLWLSFNEIIAHSGNMALKPQGRIA